MKTTMRIFALALALAVSLVLVQPSDAQTTMTSTTTTAIMTATQATVPLTSMTGVTAPVNQVSASGIGNPSGTGIVMLYIDQELVRVNSVNTTSLTAFVSRGFGGTRATTHKSGATVWVGPASAYRNFDPNGQCQRTLLAYVPLIVPSTGRIFDCLGVTTAGAYVQVNAPGYPVLGSTVASATTIIPTGTLFTISGTAAIVNITNPAGITPGMTLYVFPSGVFTWTAAGNLSLAGTAVVGKTLILTWNGTSWFPSYIA